MLFLLQADVIDAAERLSNPYIAVGALIVLLAWISLTLWKELSRERASNKTTMEMSIALITKIEIRLQDESDTRKRIVEIHDNIHHIKEKLESR